MYAFLEGKITLKKPSYIHLNVNGTGYLINISLNTYSKIEPLKSVKLWVELVVREDAMTLYGFYEKEEKALFGKLISVSGVGSSTAILVLSGLKINEFKSAIIQRDLDVLCSIKGIGKKTAERLVLDLKDKISADELHADGKTTNASVGNKVYEEALNGLKSLGISNSKAKKVLKSIRSESNEKDTGKLIKMALKKLSS